MSSNDSPSNVYTPPSPNTTCFSMGEDEKAGKRETREYVQVPTEKRYELLRTIHCEHITIKAASEQLKINYSTAKNIVKMFKTYGRINKLPKRKFYAASRCNQTLTSNNLRKLRKTMEGCQGVPVVDNYGYDNGYGGTERSIPTPIYEYSPEYENYAPPLANFLRPALYQDKIMIE